MPEFHLKHTAKLARLYFSDEDLKIFEPQVAGILKFVEELSKVSVEGVEPTSHPLPISNVFRPDEIKESKVIDSVLKHAPASKHHFFEVPKVIEDK